MEEERGRGEIRRVFIDRKTLVVYKRKYGVFLKASFLTRMIFRINRFYKWLIKDLK